MKIRGKSLFSSSSAGDSVPWGKVIWFATIVPFLFLICTMNSISTLHYSLEKARQIILAKIPAMGSEVVPLKEAAARIVVSDTFAALPQPSFDESTRDGYVIANSGNNGGEIDCFRLLTEIPAGRPYPHVLCPGTACKIMTGGCIPEGGTRVIPYEDCLEKNGSVLVTEPALQAPNSYLKKIGSDIAQGTCLVPAGMPLGAGQLALLSSCGIDSVEVAARPRVGYVCTGSELAGKSEGLEKGQKVSSNAYLLRGELTSVGALPVDSGIREDNKSDLLDLFTNKSTLELNVLLTTGGMGPGKYDLVEKVFVEAGGTVFFNSIAMRPGKSILFGLLGKTVFFGLPGPPNAVNTLLNELVGPALLAMQGIATSWPKKLEAHLLHQVTVKRNDVLRLKDGVLSMDGGKCTVRFADRLETPNCFLLLPEGQAHYAEGDMVTIHLANRLGLSL